MPIEEISLIDISLNLHINNGSEIGLKVRDDFRSESLYSCIFDPLVNVVGSLNALSPTICFPIGFSVEALAHVFDLDVLDERRKSGLCELLLDEGLAFLS